MIKREEGNFRKEDDSEKGNDTRGTECKDRVDNDTVLLILRGQSTIEWRPCAKEDTKCVDVEENKETKKEKR